MDDLLFDFALIIVNFLLETTYLPVHLPLLLSSGPDMEKMEPFKRLQPRERKGRSLSIVLEMSQLQYSVNVGTN